MRPVVMMSVSLLLAAAAACTNSSALEPTAPLSPTLKTLDFEVWPISAPDDAPSTYGVRLRLTAVNGTVHVHGVTLSLSGQDAPATGLECGQSASSATLVVGYPKQIADADICRVNVPIGTLADAATLAVSYTDDRNRSSVFRTNASIPPLTPPPALELQEFTMKIVPPSTGRNYYYYSPRVTVREVNGGPAVITSLRLIDRGGVVFESDCPWSSPKVAPNATWSSTALSYCEPYTNTTVPLTSFTIELTYVPAVGTRTPTMIRATTTTLSQ